MERREGWRFTGLELVRLEQRNLCMNTNMHKSLPDYSAKGKWIVSCSNT